MKKKQFYFREEKRDVKMKSRLNTSKNFDVEKIFQFCEKEGKKILTHSPHFQISFSSNGA